MRSARFITSATQRSQYPRSYLPQIAFVGRSNVGKSSLINCLVGRKNLARISSTPGRTQLINFYNWDEQLILVDLPGYGFARVPARVRAQWEGMIEEFLRESETLKRVITIVDARHDPTELDQKMLEWLRHYQLPYTVVATKVDKLSNNQRVRSLKRHAEILGSERVVPFSSVTGLGKKELWKLIEASGLQNGKHRSE